jgi:protein with PEP-CTERM/exosortase system signal
VPNSAISGFTGPYATVTIQTTNGTNTATITFTSLSNGNNMYLIGDGHAFALNTNGAATVSGVTFTQAANLIGFAAPSVTSLNGSGNVDGFGSFNNDNSAFDGFDHAFSQVSFTLTKNSGTWMNASQVLTGNGQGTFAAAHIFVATIRADGNVYQSDGALSTGFAGNGGSFSIPDGGTTVMLLGMALGVLGMARRFVRS